MPTVLGSRYELRAMLGTGSMARVVEAYDSMLGREVAIKFLRSDAADAEGRARFVREAHAAASFVHPHVVTVYDAGEEGTRPFLVMELVRGPNLAEVMRARGPLSAAESVAIAAQMLDALAAAHDLGWLHRDVKPSNVLFVDATTIKLTDFGLAKSMHDVAGGITRPGQVLGTPMYLAPEQSRGRRTTPSSDLYSVGIVLFQMLTGGVPYSGRNLVEVAVAHQEAPVPPVLRDDVPDALAVAVARAMAKDPLDRYPSARAMQAALLASVATPQFASR
jgi:serine/threonine-protein kinase